MSDFEQEPYSTIFSSLKHPVRRKILRMLSEKHRSFSEMLEALGISSSHLTYHLENLGELVSKMDDGKYRLSTFGEAAVVMMSKVEEVPKATEAKRSRQLSNRWKFFYGLLMVALVVVASLSYAQHQYINTLSAECEQLKEMVELVKKGAVLLRSYTLRCEPAKIISYIPEHFEAYRYDNYSEIKIGPTEVVISPWSVLPQWCAVYVPYDNFTLNLYLFTHATYETVIPITVQEGDIFNLETQAAAPIIWSANATITGIYSVPLTSKGWYTISLFGPVSTVYPSEIRLTGIRCEMTIEIICQGELAPFIVKPEPS